MRRCLQIVLGILMVSIHGAWPPEVQDITYPCLYDTSMQPAMYYDPGADGPVPLLVGLHSWSWSYTTGLSEPYGQWAVDSGWAFIAPNFRGPNGHPISTGSNAVVQDIIDAVAYVKSQVTIDTNRIYVIGLSGGGHATMLMSGKAADIWGGASAWVGVSDLTAYYQESIALGTTVWQSIQSACGGNPVTDSAAAAQSYTRSPIHFLHNAVDFNIDINAGINDGTVPVSQSLRAFNVMAAPEDTLTEEEMAYFVTEKAVPPSLTGQAPYDPLYGTGGVLFRRTSNSCRITVFNGGHVINYKAALTWLSLQRRNVTTTRTGKADDALKMGITAYPNPFNPRTIIQIQTTEAQRTQGIHVNMYNLNGQKVKTEFIFKERFETNPAMAQCIWDASDCSSGVYIISVRVGRLLLTKQVALIR